MGHVAIVPRSRRRKAPVSVLDLGPEGPRLEILGELGKGGMGTVWRVREQATGRVLALKQLLPNRVSTRAMRRFLRECHISGSLRHPGIVRVHSAGAKAGRPWLLSELVEGGRTLRDVFDDPTTTRSQRLRLVLEVARAVGFAHGRGVIHRDLKPDNVLVDPEGHARLTDFGLAKVDDGDRLTRTGSMVGTPHYMAPEQITGDQTRQGPATDVWALGVMLYQALAGELPFQRENLSALSAQICNTQPKPLGVLDATIAPALQRVCARTLRKQPDRRYANGAAFAAALEEALQAPRAATAPPRWLLPTVAGLAGAALVAALVLCLGGGETRSPLAPLELAAVSGQTTEETLDLRGFGPAEGWVEVTAGAEQRRVPLRKGRFVCRGLELAPGLNSISARLLPDGEPARCQIERLAAPAWYWQERERPPFPLPAGVVFGEAPGDYVNVADGSLLRWIPPGNYSLGEESSLAPRSRPRSVRLQQGYFAGKFEVTWAQYARFCKATGRKLPDPSLSDSKNGLGVLDPMIRKGPEKFRVAKSHPVFRVSFHDATAYCEWAGLRLPDGDQWEIAARGHDATRYPWGNRGRRDRANTETARDGHFYPSPVGSFPEGASPFGCLDMAGNVSEWTTDYFPGQTQTRTCRGGSWNVSFDYCETTFLEPNKPHIVYRSIGFRVFRGLESSAP